MNPRPINYVPEGIERRWSILWYCSFLIIPSIFTSDPVPSQLKHPQTITEPSPCFTVGAMQFGLNLSLLSRRTYCRLLVPNSSNFDSSLHKTFFHWAIVQSLCSLTKFSLFKRFAGRSSGFLTAIRPMKPFSRSRRFVVDREIGAFKLWLILARISGAVLKWFALLMIIILESSLLEVFRGRPERNLFALLPVSRYFLTIDWTVLFGIWRIALISFYDLPVFLKIVTWARFSIDISRVFAIIMSLCRQYVVVQTIF